MKNKKGFTLIEIIICIGLIVLIGTSSIIGFKIISNKNLVTKLDGITDQAINAAQVYIETNDTAYNQLYNNKNGIRLPLQLLVNEGLLNLDGTNLTETDIEKEYVVTFLGGTNGTENCKQIQNVTSWEKTPIYLCLNSNGSNPNNSSNKTYIVNNSIYYFAGIDPDNYANISGTVTVKFRHSKTTENVNLTELVSKSRIYAIDRNDDILVAITLNTRGSWVDCFVSETGEQNCGGGDNTSQHSAAENELLKNKALKSSITGILEETWLMKVTYYTSANYNGLKYQYI